MRRFWTSCVALLPLLLAASPWTVTARGVDRATAGAPPYEVPRPLGIPAAPERLGDLHVAGPLAISGTPSVADRRQTAELAQPDASTLSVNTNSIVIDAPNGTVAQLIANPGADGKISLPEAIRAVDNTGPGYTINFKLPLGATIAPTGTLFLLQPQTTIDGDVNGSSKPGVVLVSKPYTQSLGIFSDHNVIQNMVTDGVGLDGPNSFNNVVRNNYFGTDVSGNASNPQFRDVTAVEVRDGAHHNTVSGNVMVNMTDADKQGRGGVGVNIIGNAHDNVVTDNRIGVSLNGTVIPNDEGILVAFGSYNNRIGGPRTGTACTGECNLISASNTNGIVIVGSGSSGNSVVGNFVGTDLAGTTAVPNAKPGIAIAGGAAQNVIGGTRPGTTCTGPCNLISGNTANGIIVSGAGTTTNTIQGNYIGVTINGNAALPNTLAAVALAAGTTKNQIGGARAGTTCAGVCNLISGNQSSAVFMTGAGTSQNNVQGNFMGVAVNGTTPLPNHNKAGIELEGSASSNLIGGARAGIDCTDVCNVISGSPDDVGVGMTGAGTNSNTVQGNFIGVDVNGTAAVPDLAGVGLFLGAASNTIGGDRAGTTCAGVCNVISGNTLHGVYISDAGTSNNTVRGNYIGTNKNGTAATVGNVENGVFIVNASDNVIGGPVATIDRTSNRIAGNQYGIVVTQDAQQVAHHDTLRGNVIADNTKQAIDLTPPLGPGVDATGSNDGLPAPVLDQRGANASATVWTGSANAPDGSTVDLYGGAGRTYAGSGTVSGKRWSVTVAAGVATPLQEPVVAMVTDPNGNSSEFSVPTPNTPIGDNVTVTLPCGARLTFTKVTAAGTTTCSPIDPPSSAGTPPAGYTIRDNGPAFNLVTTAAYTPPVTVCFTVSDVNDANQFARLRILHGENGALVDRTVLPVDFSTRTVCARVTSLSPFVMALAPPLGPCICRSCSGSLGAERPWPYDVPRSRTS